jgi:hypothetical protein
LQQLIADHYQGEAQLLTTGAEENLLKLGELRGTLDEAQAARWAQIKRDFLRHKAMGADDGDVGPRVVAQLNDLVESVRGLEKISDTLRPAPVAAANRDAPWPELLAALERLSERIVERTPAPVNAVDPAPAAPGPEVSSPWFERHAELQLQLQQVLTLLTERLATLQTAAHAPARRRRAAPDDPALPQGEREAQLQKALEEFSDRLLGRTPR